MKFTFRYLSLILSLVFVLSVGGAYAIWEYATLPIDAVDTKLNITMGDFLWEGSGSLPTEDEIGQNHISLLDNIVNHPEHGLNASGSYLNDQIDVRQSGGSGWRSGRDTLGSMAVTQSKELDEIFGLSANALSFLIQFASDTEYYIFTTGVYLGKRGNSIFGYNTQSGKPTVPIGQNIYPIYKTVVKYIDGKWTIISTVEGYARSAWYEESRKEINATQIPSFDPDTFVEGAPEQ